MLLVIGFALQRGLFDLVRGDAICISDSLMPWQAVGILAAGTLVFMLRARLARSADGMSGKER